MRDHRHISPNLFPLFDLVSCCISVSRGRHVFFFDNACKKTVKWARGLSYKLIQARPMQRPHDAQSAHKSLRMQKLKAPRLRTVAHQCCDASFMTLHSRMLDGSGLDGEGGG